MGERIMVVPREPVTGPLGYYGAIPVTARDLNDDLFAYAESRPRDDVEHDESYLQVIPYVMLMTGGGMIGARRLGGGNEARLHERYALGFGGHVRWAEGEQHIAPQRVVERAVRHELNEEIGLDLNLTVPPFTHLLLDDTDPVGRVHVGLLARLDLDALLGPDRGRFLRSNEPEKLRLVGISQVFLEHHGDKLEGWARLALHALTVEAVG